MKPTLVVMAAGIGSRYGGLKQLDGLGPNGETLLDYGIADAIRAGFGKVVFVIRHSFETEFREKVLSKYEKRIETVVCFQELDDLPTGFSLPAGREKPWGTTQAVLVTRDAVDGPFAVINADDFYGGDAFRRAAEFLGSDTEDFALVGYELRNTLSPHGTVSRGVCEVDHEGFLKGVVEHLKVEADGNGAVSHLPDGSSLELSAQDTASMNFWCFRPAIFPELERLFTAFLKEKGAEMKSECYIPSTVDVLIREGKARVHVLRTTSLWFGITYREDRPRVQEKLAGLAGEYPA